METLLLALYEGGSTGHRGIPLSKGPHVLVIYIPLYDICFLLQVCRLTKTVYNWKWTYKLFLRSFYKYFRECYHVR